MQRAAVQWDHAIKSHMEDGLARVQTGHMAGHRGARVAWWPPRRLTAQGSCIKVCLHRLGLVQVKRLHVWCI